MAKKVGRPKKVDINIETNNADIEYQRDGTNHNLKYDGKKVDVHITKDETGTKVEVQSENKFLKALATLASKFIVKRFKKSK